MTKKVGRYEIGKTIGGHSTVKECIDRESGETFAIRTLGSRQMPMVSSVVDRHRKEIDAMRLLRHRNVVRVYDVFHSKHHLYWSWNLYRVVPCLTAS
jgi:serine/threonine protein kinase